MFTSHFSMIAQPFCEKTNTTFIMKDERFTQAACQTPVPLDLRLHCRRLRTKTGVGKSTLLNLFLSLIPLNQFLPVYVHFTHVKTSSLFALIVSQLREIPKHTKDRLFLQIIDKDQALKPHSHPRHRRGAPSERRRPDRPQTPHQLHPRPFNPT